MIPQGEAVRNAVRVEWMRLETVRQMRAAGEWMKAHGLIVNVDCYPIAITGPDGAFMRARLGDVLAFNPASGEFTVWDEGHFQAAHSEVAQ